VLIDLDYFKEINDQFGHAVGYLALKEFSRSLRKAIRACDMPVRLGGDEFLLVLPECPRDKVIVILQRIGTRQSTVMVSRFMSILRAAARTSNMATRPIPYSPGPTRPSMPKKRRAQ
jgi:diguanylate cyclase (GGDEF)-like protein